MLKFLFQKLQIDKAHPVSWENSPPPGALLMITAWGQVEASGPLCYRERQRPPTPENSHLPRTGMLQFLSPNPP